MLISHPFRESFCSILPLFILSLSASVIRGGEISQIEKQFASSSKAQTSAPARAVDDIPEQPLSVGSIQFGVSQTAVDSRGALVARTWRDLLANAVIGRTIAVNPPTIPVSRRSLCLHSPCGTNRDEQQVGLFLLRSDHRHVPTWNWHDRRSGHHFCF